MQMILLGRPMSADEARSAGLVAQLYESGEVLDSVVQDTATSLAALSPMALGLAKEAICKCKWSPCSDSIAIKWL
jgi:enoyl-CoA hydratase